uniref:Uncharacterized protein n=1 Tax=Candidatus Kentrum sp. MB TaxID=2138164 RepID=A0A450Y0W7_9GAMM|nr:MAG: hypothetical protein BECKMB1821I_GA0114274_11035 [Candidatus Kentron sp. MB]
MRPNVMRFTVNEIIDFNRATIFAKHKVLNIMPFGRIFQRAASRRVFIRFASQSTNCL